MTSLTSDIASGTTFSLGTTTVTYTASDDEGNTTTMTFDVIVEDNEAPTITEAAAIWRLSVTVLETQPHFKLGWTDNAGADATDNCVL